MFLHVFAVDLFSAAMNIPVYVFLVKTSTGAIIRSGLAGSCGMCIFTLVDTEKQFSKVVVSVYIAISNI